MQNRFFAVVNTYVKGHIEKNNSTADDYVEAYLMEQQKLRENGLLEKSHWDSN